MCVFMCVCRTQPKPPQDNGNCNFYLARPLHSRRGSGDKTKEKHGAGRENGWRDTHCARRECMRSPLLTTCRGDHLVQEFGAGSLPDLLDHRTQLLVGLVDVALCLDLQGGSNQGEQGGVEHDGAIAVEGHVHADQSLGTQAEGWGECVCVLCTCVCVCVLCTCVCVCMWMSVCVCTCV